MGDVDPRPFELGSTSGSPTVPNATNVEADGVSATSTWWFVSVVGFAIVSESLVSAPASTVALRPTVFASLSFKSGEKSGDPPAEEEEVDDRGEDEPADRSSDAVSVKVMVGWSTPSTVSAVSVDDLFVSVLESLSVMDIESA